MRHGPEGVPMVRRELYRWAVLALVQVRVWRARHWDLRSKMLRLDAQWERQEAQRMLDDLPPSLLRRR
jgi:hypothetical protein